MFYAFYREYKDAVVMMTYVWERGRICVLELCAVWAPVTSNCVLLNCSLHVLMCPVASFYKYVCVCLCACILTAPGLCAVSQCSCCRATAAVRQRCDSDGSLARGHSWEAWDTPTPLTFAVNTTAPHGYTCTRGATTAASISNKKKVFHNQSWIADFFCVMLLLKC